MTLLDYLWSKAPANEVFHRQGDGVRVDLKELYGERKNGVDCNLIADVLDELIPSLFSMYWAGTETYDLTEEELAKLRGIELRLDPGTEDYDTDVRRPYYQMRGKRVTPEQAREIIRRTDNFLDSLNYPDCSSSLRENGFIGSTNFNQWWFMRNHAPTHYGWSHPDGTIGENAITQKYPNFGEYLCEILRWKLAFPYLDLMIAVSGWNENPPYWHDATDAYWDKLFPMHELSDEDTRRKKEERDRVVYMDFPDFCENLEIGICTHDNVIEFLNPENAARRYREYEAKYSAADPKIYVPDYYEDRGLLICDSAYLRRCLADYGLTDAQIDEILAHEPGYTCMDSEFPDGR